MYLLESNNDKFMRYWKKRWRKRSNKRFFFRAIYGLNSLRINFSFGVFVEFFCFIAFSQSLSSQMIRTAVIKEFLDGITIRKQ